VLALVQGFVANQGDAWNQRLDHLGHFLEECLLRPPEELAPELADRHAVEVMRMGILGRRTAELHAALAISSGDPAFDPEPITDRDIASWTREIEDEADATLTALAQAVAQGTLGAAGPLAETLLGARERIRARLGGHLPPGISGRKTRFHGDYHLGQVLVVEGDFLIIDFEGEPERPIAERRRKLSPLKDVAGMLRSFDYAAHAAVQRATIDRPHDRERLAPFARDWERRASDAFVASYREAAAGGGFLPEDPAHVDALIELFTWQKALYELRYELAERPEWVAVPLAGLAQLLGEPASSAAIAAP